MNKITVDAAKLKNTLIQNHAVHVQEFKEAWKVYQTSLAAKFKMLAEDTLDGCPDPRKFAYRILSDLPQPQSHADDYRLALRMLDLHTEPSLSLDEASFRKLVDDEWEWSQTFKSTNSNYSR